MAVSLGAHLYAHQREACRIAGDESTTAVRLPRDQQHAPATPAALIKQLDVTDDGDIDGPDAKKLWTRIGAAFENRDGSWNLRFDYFPTSPATTVQLRDIDVRNDDREDEGRRERSRGA